MTPASSNEGVEKMIEEAAKNKVGSHIQNLQGSPLEQDDLEWAFEEGAKWALENQLSLNIQKMKDDYDKGGKL